MLETVPRIFACFFGAYVMVSTFFGLKIVRGSLMNWYNSKPFFAPGKEPVDLFFKQIILKTVWEVIVLAASAVVGSLGGAIYMIFLKPD